MTEQKPSQAVRKRNRLAGETSPYLLQHADNPVDWYPWGDEAFRRAAEEDKPVFLSIGYSSCHWCHVMEEESFRDEEVADLLNRGFVAVKVDREERPDIDSTYMTAAQMITGGGGWPLTLFLTPDRRPFFAATYLPKEPKYGMAGLTTVLPAILQFWHERREEIEQTSGKVVEALNELAGTTAGGGLGEEALMEAYRRLRASFDTEHGGFGGAPKFPTPHRLTFLLRYWRRSGESEALDMVERTLEAMRRGGIYDQLDGGFHRYSTDPAWLVPHFEKMLYDQAMLLMAYVEGWQATGHQKFERTAREIADYVLDHMTSPQGGFFSAEDADSEGEEGKYYLWTEDELASFLTTEELDAVRATFGVTSQGNLREGLEALQGKNVLHLVAPMTPTAERAAGKMLARREQRPPPFKDGKILTDWNGLMIAALAKAYGAWRDPRHGTAARTAAEFVLEHMRDGGLLHVHRDGRSAVPAFLDDHAFMAWGLLELYAADPQLRWLEEAMGLADTLLAEFADPRGGFLLTAHGQEALAPVKVVYDGAVPSGNSVALLVLVTLHRITGREEYRVAAERTVSALSGAVFRSPDNHAQFLNAVDLMASPPSEVVLAGTREGIEPFLAELGKAFAPTTVVVHASGEARVAELSPLVQGRETEGRPVAHVCTGRTCQPPTGDPAAAVRLLSS